jgi:hypothetical protein
MLTPLLHLVTRLKMCGSIPLLSQYAFVTCTYVLHAVRPMGGMEIQLHSLLTWAGSVIPAALPLKNSPIWGWVGLGGVWAFRKSDQHFVPLTNQSKYIYIQQQHKHFSTTAVSGTRLSSRVENQTGAVTLTLTAGSHTSASCNIHALLHGLVSRLVSITIYQCQLPCINFCYGLLSIKIANHQLFSTLSVIHSR